MNLITTNLITTITKNGATFLRLMLTLSMALNVPMTVAAEDPKPETQTIDPKAINESQLTTGKEIPNIKSSRGKAIWMISNNQDGTYKVHEPSVEYGSREGILDLKSGRIVWMNTTENSTQKFVRLRDPGSPSGGPKGSPSEAPWQNQKFTPFSTVSPTVYGAGGPGKPFRYWTQSSQPGSENASFDSNLAGRPSESPSRIGNTLGWTPYAGSEMVQAQRDLLLNSPRGSQMGGMGTKLKNGAIFLSTGAATFYFAMGLIAGGEVLFFEGGNPVALKRYFESLSDPVGIASMVGFLAAAAPFMKAAYRETNLSSFIRYFPLMTAGLVAGGIVSSLISTLGRDPLVRKCLNLDKVKELAAGQKVDRDLNACEMVYQSWDTRKVTELMAPSLASTVGNGLVVFGAGYQLKNLVSALGKAPVLKSLRIPKLNLIGSVDRRIGILIGVTATSTVILEAFALSEKIFEFEKMTKEKLLLTYSWQKESLGATLTQALNGMSTNLGFAERDHFLGLQTVEDLMAAESHLSDKLFAWRNLQLELTKYQIARWKDKLALFLDKLNLTYMVYRDILTRIQKERSNSLPENNPQGLSWENLDQAFINPNFPQLYGEMEDPGDWRFVETKNLAEYLITSMACGPETEHRSHEFSSIRFFKNDRPDIGPVIRRKGFADDFRPPLVTSPNSEQRVCDQNPFGTSDYKASPREYVVLAQVRDLDGTTRTVKERRLLDYIRRNIRPEILNKSNQLNFDSWWKTNVLPQVDQSLDHYSKLYDDIVRGPYRSALVDQSIVCLNAFPRAGDIVDNGGLVKEAFKSRDCSSTQRAVMRGILPSAKSEAAFYKMVTEAAIKASSLDYDPSKTLNLFSSVMDHLDKSIDEIATKDAPETPGSAVIDYLERRRVFLDKVSQVRMSFHHPPTPTKEEVRAEYDANQKMQRQAEYSKGDQTASQKGLGSNTQSDIPEDVYQRLSKVISEKKAAEFLKKRPNLALVLHNLSQLESLFDQLSLYRSMSRTLERSGAGFLKD